MPDATRGGAGAVDGQGLPASGGWWEAAGQRRSRLAGRNVSPTASGGGLGVGLLMVGGGTTSQPHCQVAQSAMGEAVVDVIGRRSSTMVRIRVADCRVAAAHATGGYYGEPHR